MTAPEKKAETRSFYPIWSNIFGKGSIGKTPGLRLMFFKLVTDFYTIYISCFRTDGTCLHSVATNDDIFLVLQIGHLWSKIYSKLIGRYLTHNIISENKVTSWLHFSIWSSDDVSFKFIFKKISGQFWRQKKTSDRL